MTSYGGEIEGEDDVVCIEITQKFSFKAAVKPKFNFKGKGYGKPELGPKRVADTAITCADYEPATRRMFAGTENAELCYWIVKVRAGQAGKATHYLSSSIRHAPHPRNRPPLPSSTAHFPKRGPACQ